MILIVSHKNVYAAKRLLAECRILNAECRILSAEELEAVDFKVDIKLYTCLYVRNPYFNGSPKYIPEIIKLAKKFKEAGKKVVDANIVSGHLGEGKWKDYLTLKKLGISMPKTFLDAKKSYILYPKPYILKWIYGMKAKGTFLIRSENDLKKRTEIKIFSTYPNTP
jgi:glutathione synthase/RimK-type ligase-like ATP-grasp enzyme